MTTPMRRQYLRIKKEYPEAIVFFRLGDFYETFDEDAKIVAQVCDIVLTSRPVGKKQRVPLAGVPYHAAEGYIAKLIQAGHKVAIVEQVGEVPAKGIVDRAVARVVTPGTVVEPTLLDERRNNYLAAIVVEERRAGLAYADITTGEFAATEWRGAEVHRRVLEELARLAPAEVVTADPQFLEQQRLPGSLLEGLAVTELEGWPFELETARQTLRDHFAVARLEGFGLGGRPLATRAAGGLLHYLAETQRTRLGQLTALHTYSTEQFMALDAATRRNLELTESLRRGTVQGSLLGVLDATVTSMGGRLLRRWINQPLLDVEQIDRRLDAVQAFFDDTPARTRLRALLKKIADLERLTGRVAQRIARPRDLLGIRHSLETLPDILEAVAAPAAQAKALAELTTLDRCRQVAELIRQALVDDPPATLSAGGVIRPGFSAELDNIAAASREAKAWVANLEKTERARTGIKNLKVGYNKVFGYYLEVTKANADRVPPEYIRKQTLVNAERYITPELKEYESLILNAQERIADLEGRIYSQVVEQVAAAAERLLAVARALARLDVYAALAETALMHRYVRPALSEDGELHIIAGRHPVVEVTQREEPFVPNDTHFSDEERILVITGPNMSGKCVTGDTLVFTDAGLVPIASLQPGPMDDDTFAPFACQVKGLDGRDRATHFYRGGRSRTVRIRTRLGYEIEGTPDHRLWVRSESGQEGWKSLADIEAGDYVAIEREIDLWGQQEAIETPQAAGLRRRKSLKLYSLPSRLSPDLAYVMGLLIGDGTLRERNALILTSGDDFISQEFSRIMRELFGYQVRHTVKYRYSVSSRQIRLFFEELGMGYVTSIDKSVPPPILRAPKPVVAAFLQGLFDADAHASARGNVCLSTSSATLARQVHTLLLNFGIVSSLQAKKGVRSANPNYNLCIYGAEVLRFYREIGFRLPRKQAGRERVSSLAEQRYFYDPVTEISEGQAEVFDLSVAGSHAFVANGFVNHNSTYLRQVALVVLMAQIGSFVPADEAHIGLVDRIFTRIGAQDEISAGQSTFMVEMVETANLLNHATPRSLLVLDEVGRGTSTYDGISIAWAVVEHIHNHPHLRCRTLFATHYHELTQLADLLPRVRNYNVAVAEEKDRVVFLRHIVPGGADRSYGIHVAQLAGLPRPVIRRAQEILEELEQEARAPGSTRRTIEVRQLPLFRTSDPVLEELRRLDVSAMSPLEAITKLYELQQKAAG
ncbi:MAG TPA: DNA mismatch repair protein MutS [Anaerolineae bacterium]|nr:DNA mismatch repair protein MutS [Anaerolineae bacterium]